MSTTQVFIPHEEFVWVTGNVVSDDGKGILSVRIQDDLLPDETGVKTINLAKIGIPSLPPQNNGLLPQGVEDMTKLNYLHEPAILDNLKRRFAHKLPYTYTGNVCIAVNPYQWLPLYTETLRNTYSKVTRFELAPHVYATSTDAYRGLTVQAKNQSILVTGESGAGKTETVKILMGHLAFIAGKANDRTIDKLLKANPLLESFGNAKTGRNDNSSRFGKFSQLEFDDMYALVGSKCITYLLEKSRVITQTKLERNFHIMYQLLAAPEVVKQKLLLSGKKSTHFNYTNAGDTTTSIIEGKTDSEHYASTIQGLELLGVGPKLRDALQQAIAGILHMGQIGLHAIKGNADTATLAADNGKYDESTVACCKLLGVSTDLFANSVVSRQIEVEGKSLSVPLSVEQAASGRDALAKEIYNRIFNWLVLVVNYNTSFSANNTEVEKQRMIGRTGACTTISLLDIFGFEQFPKNGFEQFCINYANEKLQQRFTYDVFMTVQKEYQEEGLPWEIIKYKDNQETLDMIEGRLSIVDLLNEECQIPKGTDSNFYSKIKQNFDKHFAFSTDPRSRDEFTVRHYAGPVTYTVTGFMDANKDAVPNNLETMVGQSDNVFLRRLFADTLFFRGDSELLLAEKNEVIMNMTVLHLDVNEKECVNFEVPKANSDPSGALSPNARGRASMRMGRQPSGGFVVSEKILTKFKNQLGSLMNMVNATDVQYVRCVKPNPNKSSTQYDRRMVVDQLRSAGMIEAVRISRAAFPNRLLYRDFMGTFKILAPKSWHDNALRSQAGMSVQEKARNLAEQFLRYMIPENKKALSDGTGTTEHYAFGRTKVYFDSYVQELLQQKRSAIVNKYATEIQRVVRGHLCRLKHLTGEKLKAKKAEDEAKQRKILEAQKRAEEEARRIEEERVRKLEEERAIFEAKLRRLEELEMRQTADAEEIERLKKIIEGLNIEIEALKAQVVQMQALTKALTEKEALLEQERTRAMQLESKVSDNAAKISQLESTNSATQKSLETATSRAKIAESSVQTSNEQLAVAAATEALLNTQIREKGTEIATLNSKLQDTNDKKAAVESAQRKLAVELEESQNTLETKIAEIKSIKSELLSVNESLAEQKDAYEKESTRANSLQSKALTLQGKVDALELVAATIPAMKAENIRLTESVSDLESAKQNVDKQRAELYEQVSTLMMQLQEAQAKIEDLESRPVGPATDGRSVISGDNDFEIVIDEDKGKMKIVIHKRRPEGATNSGVVERITVFPESK